MNRIIDIPEGRTNDYLIHGLFVVIAAGILFLVHWSLTILLLAVAVGLFQVASGIEVDLAGERARVYKALGKLRLGSWVVVGAYTNIDIRYTNVSQVMSYRGVETNVRVRTYELYFRTSKDNERFFHEFTDYEKARKCSVVMADAWSLQITDEVQERRQKAQDRALGRKR